MPIKELKITSMQDDNINPKKMTIVGGPTPHFESQKKKCMNFKKCRNHTFISHESIEFVKNGAKVICPNCFFALSKKKDVEIDILMETINRALDKFQARKAS